MSKGLEALKDLLTVIPIETYHFFGEGIEKAKSIIKKELKESDTIKARLTLVEIKIKARREECMDNVINTDEDSYIHDTNLTIVRELDWFRDLLKEVLL